MPVQTTGTRADINNATSGSQTLAVTAGDLIIVSASVSEPTGVLVSGSVTDGVNTYALDGSTSNGNLRAGIWSAVAASSTTLTIVLDPPGAAAFASFNSFSFRGQAASAFDKTAAATGTSTAPATGSTATLTQKDELIVGVFGIQDTTTNTVTVPATTGYTNYWVQNDSTSAEGGAGDYKLVAATTAVAAAWTFTNSKAWAAVICTYKINLVTTAVASSFTHMGAALNVTHTPPVLTSALVPSPPPQRLGVRMFRPTPSGVLGMPPPIVPPAPGAEIAYHKTAQMRGPRAFRASPAAFIPPPPISGIVIGASFGRLGVAFVAVTFTDATQSGPGGSITITNNGPGGSGRVTL